MKELSIEEKAKAYDEAIERARKIHNEIEFDYKRDMMEVIFPELKESDDERIRKELIDFLEYYRLNNVLDSKTVFLLTDSVAWLEKQGEQKVIIPKFRVGDVIRYDEDGEINRVVEIVEEGYKLEHGTHILCFNSQDYWELVEQKPWSEEDEKYWSIVIAEFSKCAGKSVSKDEWMRCNDWLNFLRDRALPQSKQEWSQNDIDMIDWLIRCCEKEHEELCNDKYGHQDIVSDLKRDCRKKWDWLESLKNRVAPQNTWKPSEEQMKALNYVVNLMASSESPRENDYYYNVFKDLRKQLKKLREE